MPPPNVDEQVLKNVLLTADDALVDDHFSASVLNLSQTEYRPADRTERWKKKSDAAARLCIYVLLTSPRVGSGSETSLLPLWHGGR